MYETGFVMKMCLIRRRNLQATGHCMRSEKLKMMRTLKILAVQSSMVAWSFFLWKLPFFTGAAVALYLLYHPWRFTVLEKDRTDTSYANSGLWFFSFHRGFIAGKTTAKIAAEGLRRVSWQIQIHFSFKFEKAS